jgi:hypothetical protein
MTNQVPPSGWYPDPSRPELLRWWDGTAWTDQTQAATTLPPPPAMTSQAPPSTTTTGTAESPKHRLFGGKRELEEEVAQLRATMVSMGIPERDALREEIGQLKAELPALEAQRTSLEAIVVPLRSEVQGLQSQQTELARLTQQVQDLTSERDRLVAETQQLRTMVDEMPQLRAEYERLRSGIVETNETAILQEVGVYEYRHPLQDSPAFKARLSGIQAQIKDAVKAGAAVAGSTTWTVNGSAREGAKMVKEFSKLMLRAYNNEADNAVRSMKPYALESAIARLNKARDTIVKLGGTMHIAITDRYHKLRVEELELTADYLAKVAEEKEREREIRAKARDEAIAQREIKRELERLQKELAHHRTAAEKFRAEGNLAAADEAESRAEQTVGAIEGNNERAANIRTGSVYVISNLGAFGPDVVKIGMTRRIDPEIRVRELGDASVPFHYDIHAIVPSPDAVTLEHELHNELASYRMNWVNMRREFFRCGPSVVRDLLQAKGLQLLDWKEVPEAAEFRQSQRGERAGPGRNTPTDNFPDDDDDDSELEAGDAPSILKA